MAGEAWHDLSGIRLLPSARIDLTSRLARLTSTALQAVQAASVHEQPATAPLLAAVIEEPSAQVLESIDQGMQAGLLEPQPRGRYVFHHDLVRRAIAEDVPESQRTQWHRRWAHVLSEASDADRLNSVVAIAHHRWRGGPAREAVEACVAAAECAERLGAQTDALVQWRRVLELYDEAPELSTDANRNQVLALINRDLAMDYAGRRELVRAERKHRPPAVGLRRVWLRLLDLTAARVLFHDVAPPRIEELGTD
jgi:predicted ATPase